MWTLVMNLISKPAGLPKKALEYLQKTMSSDPSSSSVRWIQLIIVVNTVGMLWFLLIRLGVSAASTLSAWRDVAIALIVNGLAIHVASKYASTKGGSDE